MKKNSKSFWEIISSNCFTYFNLIFAVLAVLLIIAGSYRDLTFVPVVAANTLIGIVQELRAKRVLDRLTMLNAPVTTVIRDGETRSVPSEELAVGDIAVYGAGCQISADCVVTDGSVSVSEALLTGESDEIVKHRGDRLLSGSFVVSGECRAELEKVGGESYIAQLTMQAKRSRRGEQSEMIRSLDRIVRLAGIAMIPIGILLFCGQYFADGAGLQKSIQGTAAAVIGMIPEGLFLLASTALAISTMRLARENVLLHDMKCIETLARADILCADKTGTITEGRMTVLETVTLSNDNDVDSLISDFACAQSADNATMRAIKERFTKTTGRQAVSVSGFSPEFKYSSTTFADNTYVLGALGYVPCGDIGRDTAEKYSREGLRVLVFCRYDGVPEGRLTGCAEPVCLIVLEDVIRPNAAETFAFFESQGVEVKVISGDDPLTVSAAARKAGIKNAEKYIDLTGLDEDETRRKAAEYTVFGRVTPEQKRLLIASMKSAGHTVAMTGDGVNDVLALKEADCSIAVAAGSEAAAQVSQLVLLDSDFAKMPSVVREGRRVVNNLERSGSLFLVKNIFSLLTAVVVIISGIRYPLRPIQLSLVAMFTIGIPGLFMSQQPCNEVIRGQFMHNILRRAVPFGIADTVLVCAAVVSGRYFGLSEETVSNICTVILGGVGIMNAGVQCIMHNA